MYEIEKYEGAKRIICRSLDDCSALLRDYPEAGGDELEEGRALLARPELIGHFETAVEIAGVLVPILFTHRKFGGHNQDKQGWE
jgi:hypothetical protein